MSQVNDSARLLTPHTSRSPSPSPSPVFTPKRGKNKKHGYIIPSISITTPASDDGHGAYDRDDDEDAPLSHRRSAGGMNRSSSLKKAQTQISKAQSILGDNISNLDYDQQRSESLGEGQVSFHHISGSRRKNLMLIGLIASFGIIVVIVLIVIGVIAAVNKGSPF